MIIRDYKVIAQGNVEAEALASKVPLSFWGGADVYTGDIQDVHSDLYGKNASGKVLCIPQERGSCSGSGVIFEMIRLGTNPAAILCSEAEAIMALGPIIGKRVYNREMPIRTVPADVLSQIKTGDRIVFTEDSILVNEDHISEIYLAGGCFWGLQKFIDQFDGVIRTEVGYANGPESSPAYEDVCRSSGHAETVKISFDEQRISLKDLLKYYFMVIDPVSVNRQGEDAGIQYRTGIYYTDSTQLEDIKEIYDQEEKKAGQPLAVELGPLEYFWPAEEYHQKYLDKNPGGYCHIPASFFDISKDL